MSERWSMKTCSPSLKRPIDGEDGGGGGVTGRRGGDRVHDEEEGPGATPEGLVDFLGCRQRLDSDRSQLLPHRLDGFGVVYWLQRHGILQRLGSDARSSVGPSGRPVKTSKTVRSSSSPPEAPGRGHFSPALALGVAAAAARERRGTEAGTAEGGLADLLEGVVVELGFRLGTPPDADLVASRNDGQRKVNTEAAAGSLDAVAGLVGILSFFSPTRSGAPPRCARDHPRPSVAAQ